MSLFDTVKTAPKDPILGVVEVFNQDQRTDKINLSIGVYTDNAGKVPLLQAVKMAQSQLMQQNMAKSYLPIDGLASYNQAVQHLLFGAEHPLVVKDQVVTVQSVGGTGALKIGADFLGSFLKQPTAYISDPTWDNHRALFAGAGFQVATYPYFDAKTGGVAFDAMCAFFSQLAPQSVVVLHICCHNPTGADLTLPQWEILADIIQQRELIPFLDMAYQGFAKSVVDDVKPVHLMVEKGLTVFIANSFSKSFSLYGERIGALSVVTQSAEEKTRVLSQLKQCVRANYSSPPSYGAQLVNLVLTTPSLQQQWLTELEEMRLRIKTMRTQLVDLLNQGQDQQDFSFLNHQTGMFSYSGLTVSQVEKMRQDFGVYIVNTGRICVAALNPQNIVPTATAILNVL